MAPRPRTSHQARLAKLGQSQELCAKVQLGVVLLLKLRRTDKLEQSRE